MQLTNDHRSVYEAQAAQLADSVLDGWTAGAAPFDVLAERAYSTFAQAANAELRQILVQLGGQLELTLQHAANGAPVSEDRVRRLLGAVDRAHAVVDVYMDRAGVLKRLLRLQPEPFNLAGVVGQQVTAMGLRPPVVRLSLQGGQVWADRQRVTEALAHLMHRFHGAASPGHALVVSVAPRGPDGVVGFVGASPALQSAESLMAEFNAPHRLDAGKVDVPYMRALFERQGGTLYVAKREPDAVGFGFTLPSRPPRRSPDAP